MEQVELKGRLAKLEAKAKPNARGEPRPQPGGAASRRPLRRR
jgi:hypothetical protein